MSYLTVADAGLALRAGDISCTELAEAAIARADELDARLGVFTYRCTGKALEAAAAADAELAQGRDRGPLHGIPIGIKDVIATTDCPTTAHSLVLDPGWGRRGDAEAVRRLRLAGAVVLGKTTTMEFAIGAPDPSGPFPVPRNPWRLDAWTGGSSSGTASGVAAGLILGGIGTDTGGSIRVPAAFCGVTGFKPTYGLLPTAGVLPVAPCLDHVGPIARTAADCSVLFQAMAAPAAGGGHAGQRTIDGGIAGLRIGVERDHHTRAAGVDPSVAERFEQAIGTLADLGADIVEISIAGYEAVAQASVVLAFSESLALHRRDLRARWTDYGSSTRLALALGAVYTGADYAQSQRVCQAVRHEVEELWHSVDVIATITAGAGAPPLSRTGFSTGFHVPVFVTIWNALGLPAVSVPVGFDSAHLPVGMQLAGPAHQDLFVLGVASAYQRHTSWHRQLPPCTESTSH